MLATGPAILPLSWDFIVLGANELRGGRCQSLVQVLSFYRSDEVDDGRRGCCTHLLYCIVLQTVMHHADFVSEALVRQALDA